MPSLYPTRTTCLVFILLLCCTAAAMGNTPGTINTLSLGEANHRYDVNSAAQASGLYPCPLGLNKTELTALNSIERTTLKTTALPDFKQNNHYCFFINITNQTNQLNWALHFSNFFIDQVDVYLFDGTTLQEYRSDWLAGINDEKVNILGRAFPLQLEQNKHYLLAVELTADGMVAPPYIALTSKAHYHTWSEGMSYLYSLSTGIIVGLILLALLCSALLKDITFFWFGVSSLLLFSFFAIRSHLGIFVLHSTPGLPVWIWLWASATTTSVLLFARAFLLPEPSTRPIKKIFDLCIAYFLGVALLSVFLPKQWNLALYSLNGIIMMSIIFYAGIARVIESGRYYLIFMLGWVPVLFSLVEHVAIVIFEPAAYTSTLSYKILREPFYQIAHMLIHFVAMLIRIDALKKEKYQAEMRNEAKSRFLASVSHDLRQPLHSMGMFLAHLDAHIHSTAGKKVLGKVYSLHTAMNDSFKTLMDLSRLEAGAVKINNENIDLGLLIARMRLEFEPYASTKGLKIRFRCNIKKLHTDPELLERILRNLLSNALKYTEKGGVLVGFRRRQGHLLIQVWDTGCGISTADQRVVFDIYERSEKVSASHSGMGIGLAIVKHLVELLDGEITVKSADKSRLPDKLGMHEKNGTVFEIKLPHTKDCNHAFDNYSDDSDKKGVRIKLDLHQTQILNQVSDSLKNWGYLTADYSHTEKSAPITLIITECTKPLTLDSMSARVSTFEKQFGNVVIALFCDDIDRELAGKLGALNVHILSTRYRPAQLRSLIRYLESFQLKE